jgi:hypothetical protein
MMFAIYFVLAWSLVGFLAAVLMGRAIAVCAGEERQDQAGAARPARTEAGKAPRAAKAA